MSDVIKTHIAGAKNGNAQDIEYIFRAFKKSIFACASKLRGANFDFDDAVQEGNIGLFKAILSYDDQGGASFSTYAKRCILNSILSAKTSQGAQKHQVLTTAQNLEDNVILTNPETDIIIKEQNMEFIRIAKQKLSAFEFLVFSLYTMQYSYRQIARLTGKNEKSINNAVQRIHSKLRK
ncbi:MAG: sigma-70 family RNA polymerase sigma factor [Oscillospiraceae bacterium]